MPEQTTLMDTLGVSLVSLARETFDEHLAPVHCPVRPRLGLLRPPVPPSLFPHPFVGINLTGHATLENVDGRIMI